MELSTREPHVSIPKYWVRCLLKRCVDCGKKLPRSYKRGNVCQQCFEFFDGVLLSELIEEILVDMTLSRDKQQNAAKRRPYNIPWISRIVLDSARNRVTLFEEITEKPIIFDDLLWVILYSREDGPIIEVEWKNSGPSGPWRRNVTAGAELVNFDGEYRA